MASFGSKLINVVLALAFLAGFPAAASAQDTGRQTFTWKKPANFITFNSITDNPKIGDERNFVRVRDISSNNLADQITVHDGQEVVVQIYYDNDAGSNLKLQARNTRIRLELPGVSKTATVSGFVAADNSKPLSVSDTATLNSDTPFILAYEKGSAQIWNNVLRGALVSDSAVSSGGAVIGYDKIDGVVQSGPQYSGYVTLKLKVKTQTNIAATTGKVPNSGPGDVVLLFLAATLLSAAAHRKWTAARIS
jgi:hypothetical protein